MAKRNRLEIIKDILKIIQESRGSIKITPLLRKSNVSSKRFYEYLKELENKGFIMKTEGKIKITKRGGDYLEKYSAIVGFIEEFGL
jgi:predicted transcriptional regulator